MQHDHPTRLTHRTLIARGRTLLGTAVLVAAAAIAAPTHAQFGGRASFGEAFQPDMLQRDMVLLVETLNLDELQRPVMEALLEDYMVGFNTGVDALKDRMKTASQEGAKANPGNGDAILAKVMEPLNSWRSEKRRLLDKFFADVKSQLGPQQLERWPKFERALRRERQLPEGELSGESVDLWAVLGRMQLSPTEQEAIRATLDTYEAALDEALANRVAKMAALESELGEAMRNMDYDRGGNVQDRIMALRILVRGANDQGIEAITQAMGARGDEFRRAALEAGYADVYRPHPVMQLIDTARKIESLSAEQVAQIDTLRAEFQVACDGENVKFYEMLRAEEPKQPRRKVQAMLDRRAGQTRSAPSTPQASNQADPIVKLRVERDKMGEPFRERLMAILTPDQQATIPGAAKFDGDRVRPKDPHAKENSDPNRAVGASRPEDPAEAQRKSDKKAAREGRGDGKRDQRALSGAPPRTQPGSAAPPASAEPK